MKYFLVLLSAAIPLTEQKIAIPIGINEFNLNPISVFFSTWIGCLLPVPFILIFFDKIFQWLKTVEFFNGFTRFVDNKLRKNTKHMDKYKELGLIIFTGIPLPTTGLWTGSAVAVFLGLNKKKSMICCIIGSFISGVIISFVAIYFPHLL
ncbi:small multi-drug export protein [Clostridium sediminicola]|uniref:COG2426 family protein n=1 Tax=Clostridium sediminicola TaxID=3114879 RepID=UPI0031F207FD